MKNKVMIGVPAQNGGVFPEVFITVTTEEQGNKMSL